MYIFNLYKILVALMETELEETELKKKKKTSLRQSFCVCCVSINVRGLC